VDINWTDTAQADLANIYHFNARYNPQIAAGIIDSILSAGGQLSQFPLSSPLVKQFTRLPVRRKVLPEHGFEIWYTVIDATKQIDMLHVWYERQSR
jgi:plasmid stabilization system protein ParE